MCLCHSRGCSTTIGQDIVDVRLTQQRVSNQQVSEHCRCAIGTADGCATSSCQDIVGVPLAQQRMYNQHWP